MRKRPRCKYCGTPCTSNGYGNWKTVCAQCHKRPWVKFKGDICEFCGFLPVHKSQLDVDHKDRNKKNNDPSNLQTLCANCHRLKTHLERI